MLLLIGMCEKSRRMIHPVGHALKYCQPLYVLPAEHARAVTAVFTVTRVPNQHTHTT